MAVNLPKINHHIYLALQGDLLPHDRLAEVPIKDVLSYACPNMIRLCGKQATLSPVVKM